MKRTKQEISAGAVVFKKFKSTYQVILYSRNKSTQWCLPKGKIERDETPKLAALREVKEETGVEGNILSFIDDIHYSYDDKKRNLHLEKTVHYFLMQYAGGEISTADIGVETVLWMDIDKAMDKATFINEQRIIKQAKTKLLKGEFNS